MSPSISQAPSEHVPTQCVSCRAPSSCWALSRNAGPAGTYGAKKLPLLRSTSPGDSPCNVHAQELAVRTLLRMQLLLPRPTFMKNPAIPANPSRPRPHRTHPKRPLRIFKSGQKSSTSFYKAFWKAVVQSPLKPYSSGIHKKNESG